MDNLLLDGRYKCIDKHILFAWPGFTIKLNFTGTFLKINIDVPNRCFFKVDIDGVITKKEFIPDVCKYILAENLCNSFHSCKITLCHEVKEKICLKELNCDGKISKPEQNSLKMEFIGDSLTVGYGNQSNDIEWDREDSYIFYTDNSLGYAQLTAKELQSDCHITAYSGKGLQKNYNNDEPGVTVPFYYDFVYPFKNSEKWEFNKYKPDIVVINLGTNDFSNDLDLKIWEECYLNFVNRIKSIYINCNIVLISPNHIAYEIIKRVANKLNTLFYSYDITYSSLDTHPNLDEHKKISDGLVKLLKLNVIK